MTRLTGSTGALRAAITLVLTAVCALAAPAAATAGIGAGASVQLAPSTIHVGEHGTGTVRISNGNYNTPGAPADAQLTNTVCNAGTACPSVAATDRDGISVTPACAKVTASTTCVPGYEDPGVLLHRRGRDRPARQQLRRHDVHGRARRQRQPRHRALRVHARQRRSRDAARAPGRRA